MVTFSTKQKDEKDKFLELTQKAIKKFRENLLDISNRNNLINLNFNPRSNKVLRIIDEIPNSVFQKLANNSKLLITQLRLHVKQMFSKSKC